MKLNEHAIRWIKKYQKNKAIIGSGRCKHYPSCSNYAIGCYQKFGFIKASFLTLFRIIRCNPLTKKVYDPVPLNRKEKKELKQMKKDVLDFLPYLQKHTLLYPLMQLEDYLILIYESTFGPYYLKEKITTLKGAKTYLRETSLPNAFQMENIGTEYQRLYITPELATPELSNDFLHSIQSASMNDVHIQMFHEKIYLFKQQIKKKEIPLNYSTSYSYIEEYLSEGVRYLEHSATYLEHYSTNYILIKRENEKILN